MKTIEQEMKKYLFLALTGLISILLFQILKEAVPTFATPRAEITFILILSIIGTHLLLKWEKEIV